MKRLKDIQEDIIKLFKTTRFIIFEICDTSDGVNLEDKFASANILEFNISDNVTFEFKKLWN